LSWVFDSDGGDKEYVHDFGREISGKNFRRVWKVYVRETNTDVNNSGSGSCPMMDFVCY
jgi:hypothetical protein